MKRSPFVFFCLVFFIVFFKPINLPRRVHLLSLSLFPLLLVVCVWLVLLFDACWVSFWFAVLFFWFAPHSFRRSCIPRSASGGGARKRKAVGLDAMEARGRSGGRGDHTAITHRATAARRSSDRSAAAAVQQQQSTSRAVSS